MQRARATTTTAVLLWQAEIHLNDLPHWKTTGTMFGRKTINDF